MANIIGTEGSDTKTGGVGADNIIGLGGDDKLSGGFHKDQISGGDGNDTLAGGFQDDIVLGDAGNDSVAGAGNDAVSVEIRSGGATAVTTVQLGAGNDAVYLNTAGGSVDGKFSVDGGADTDLAWINRGNATASLSFTLSANATLVNGGVTLKNIERVHIESGSGADSLTGGALADHFDGGSGSDTLKGLDGHDELIGWIGDDSLDGGAGNDVLWATGGIGDTDRDILMGGTGDDQLHINWGDHASGGIDTDRVFLDIGDSSVGVNFVFSTAVTQVNANTSFDTAESIEFTGSMATDVVAAGAGGDKLDGHFGDDTLRGGSGNDELRDGDGNGSDVFAGGGGIDTLKVEFVSDLSVKLDLADGARDAGMAQGLTVSSIEVVHGSDRDDDIRGGSVGERPHGGAGGDLLDGRGGNDTLEGGGGADQLSGGAGSDLFRLAGDAVGSGDLITDFTRGTDEIAIGREGFGLTPGAALNLVTGTEPVATGSAAQFVFETDTGRLWFDGDGAGNEFDAVLVATLTNVATLDGGDFIFG
jgi:Ca2+-binding RTX toxin-like protein